MQYITSNLLSIAVGICVGIVICGGLALLRTKLSSAFSWVKGKLSGQSPS